MAGSAKITGRKSQLFRVWATRFPLRALICVGNRFHEREEEIVELGGCWRIPWLS